MGRACKTYRLRSICSAHGTKNHLPLGMESVKCAANDDSHQEFRTKCLEKFVEYSALDYMYDNVKEQSLRWYKGDELHGSDFYQPEW